MTTDTPDSTPTWLAERRERSVALAGELELPQFKGVAGWEFTDISKLELERFGPAGVPPESSEAERLFEPVEGSRTLTQVDGLWERGETSQGEPVVLALEQAAELFPELVERHLGSLVASDEDVFVARNDAGWTGGAFVYVPRGARIEEPIVVTATLASESELPWRTLVVLEEGAQAEVWEQYLSAGEETEGVLNTVVELVVGDGANLRYVCGQGLNDTSWTFGTQRAEVGRDGALDWVAVGFGSARGRVRMNTRLAGQGASAKVTGAYAGIGRQHLDFDTTQEHAAPHTTSDLAFRGILNGRSTAVWRGMIRVDPGAQQTDAFQESRNLLLSKRAHADAIPGLEIEANDVRCTHAAAIAQLDPEQLFYLHSRGLPKPVAERLVIEGFMQELVARFPEGAVHDALSGALERRLERVLAV